MGFLSAINRDQGGINQVNPLFTASKSPTGWFQPETEPRFAAKVVTWLVSFLANFKFIKMTAVHFQPPTDLLAAVEGRCIDLRSLLDLR